MPTCQRRREGCTIEEHTQDNRAPEVLLRDLVEIARQGARKVLVEALKAEYKHISKLSA